MMPLKTTGPLDVIARPLGSRPITAGILFFGVMGCADGSATRRAGARAQAAGGGSPATNATQPPQSRRRVDGGVVQAPATSTVGSRGTAAPAQRTERSDAGSVVGATTADLPETGVVPEPSARDSGVGPTITELRVEPNPNSSISCYVIWNTDVASDSEVQFGLDGNQFRIRHDALVTEHRVLVIGMYAERVYQLRAVSTAGDGQGSAEASFTTGALPAEIPDVELSVSEPGSQPGWTLTNVQLDGGAYGSGTTVPAVIVMYDEMGIPVWYYINGDTPDRRGDISLQLTANGNIVIGPAAGEAPREIDLAGNTVWEGPSNPEGYFGAVDVMSHYGYQLDDGNYAVLRYAQLEDRDLVDTQVETYSPSNELLWTFSVAGSMALPPEATSDFCHGNSLTVDLDQDALYVSCRWLGVVKARISGDQEMLWHLAGNYHDYFPGDFTFDPPEARFSDIHDPEIHEDGTVLVFDNGGYGKAEHHSRVIEYAIDEASQVATRLWEFPGDFQVDSWYTDNWYTPIWGDADRLANGNILITAGARGQDDKTRIFEVTRDGRVVWEIRSQPDRGSYGAERLSPPPLVRPLP